MVSKRIRLKLHIAAMGIQSCSPCKLALQREAPHLACDQGHVLGEVYPGLTIFDSSAQCIIGVFNRFW